MYCLAFTLFRSTSPHVLVLNFNIDLNYRYLYLEYAPISDLSYLFHNKSLQSTTILFSIRLFSFSIHFSLWICYIPRLNKSAYISNYYAIV
jgi:hypothetical protein